MNFVKKYTYPFFETVSLNPFLSYLRSYHQARINRTFRAFFPKAKPFNLNELIDDIVGKHQILGDKCRVAYNALDFKMEVSTYQRKVYKSLALLDGHDVQYAYKYSHRKNLYNEEKSAEDFLDLIHVSGRIKDFSHANILLEINGEWVTPLYPLLHGTHRDYLVANGLAVARDIFLSDLKNVTKIKPINAMTSIEEAQTFSLEDVNFGV